MPIGPWEDTALDREKFKTAILTYYRMMGWSDAGVPTPDTLIDHKIGWAAVALGASPQPTRG